MTIPKTCVLVFTVAQCVPCKKYIPRLRAACAKAGVAMVEIDAQAHTKMAAKYRVQATPTTIVIRGGEPVWQCGGALGDETIGRALESAARR